MEKENSNNNKAHIGIDSELKDVKVGTHFFTCDLVNDSETGTSFDFKEYEVKAIKKKMGAPDFYEVIDVKYPKVVIKSDLSTGYFHSKKEAAQALVDSLKFIYESALTCLNKL
jgi:hypothetical protein